MFKIPDLKNRLTFILCIFLLVLSSQPAAALEKTIAVASFSQSNMEGWSIKRFNGRTALDLQREEGIQCLSVQSSSSASALYKQTRINLQETPWLHWSWKIQRTLGKINADEKKGDDYAARIFLIADQGKSLWKNPVLAYVWSNQAEKGKHWISPFQKNIINLAVEQGNTNAGQWQTHFQNVKEDFLRLFNVNVENIILVALMTDTDGTGQSRTSCYGDIVFSSSSDAGSLR
jgi:hypothetical protein